MVVGEPEGCAVGLALGCELGIPVGTPVGNQTHSIALSESVHFPVSHASHSMEPVLFVKKFFKHSMHCVMPGAFW